MVFGSYVSEARLDLLPNLKYLTYGSSEKDLVLPYAVRQSGAIASTKCSLVKITFDIKVDTSEAQLDTAICGRLDELLSGDKFPSLENVFLHRSIAAILFPKLCNNGLLQTLRPADSYWPRYV